MFSHRMVFLYGFLACVTLIGVALGFQYLMDLEPCPLCIMQRVAIMMTGTVLLLAALHNPGQTGRRIYGVLTMLTALVGLGIASRQVWLQHLPEDQVPDCGPGLDYMLEAFPLDKALALIFKGSGECAEVQWTFIGMSIPEWMMVFFSLFIVLGIYIVMSRDKIE